MRCWGVLSTSKEPPPPASWGVKVGKWAMLDDRCKSVGGEVRVRGESEFSKFLYTNLIVQGMSVSSFGFVSALLLCLTEVRTGSFILVNY